MPLPPRELQRRERQLRELLKDDSQDGIAERWIDALYAWETVADPVTRRLYRNVSLIYDRAELKALALSAFRMILGTDEEERDNAREYS